MNTKTVKGEQLKYLRISLKTLNTEALKKVTTSGRVVVSRHYHLGD